MLAIFLIWLFPYSDISDRVTSEVLKATNKQVYLQFDDLGLSLFPVPGLALQNVTVEAAPLRTPLKANTISVYPSILGFLSFSPGVSLDITQIFGGDMHITAQAAAKGHEHLKASGESLDLKRIVDLLSSPMHPTGKLDLQTDMVIDGTFQEQPDGKARMQMKNVQLLNPQIPTMMGMFSLPNLSMKKITGDITLKAGRIQLDKVEVGDRSDALYAQVSGAMDLKITPGNPMQPVQLGAIDLTVELILQDPLVHDQTLRNVLDITLAAHKKPSQGTSEVYRFRVASANVLMVPPQTFSVP